MKETQNKFPAGYIEEAMKLKEEHMKKMKAYLKKSREQGNLGYDFGSKEEREITQDFLRSLKELQEKYHI